MGLFGMLGSKPKKLSIQENMSRFLPVTEYPAHCPAVVEHLRASILKHTGTHFPLYLFFEVEPVGALPHCTTWDRWDPSAPSDDELEQYPHIMKFAWILCNEKQHVYLARDLIIKPENYTLPPDSAEKHGVSFTLADECGASIKDVLREFCYCLAPATRIVTFNGARDGVVLETELRRHNLPIPFNRGFFYDMGERTMEFCNLREEAASSDFDDAPKPLRPPTLDELQEKLFGDNDNTWHDASHDVQILQKCFFKLLKSAVL